MNKTDILYYRHWLLLFEKTVGNLEKLNKVPPGGLESAHFKEWHKQTGTCLLTTIVFKKKKYL